MDKLDVAIIRELTQSGLILASRPGFAPSYREASRKLGVPFGTIRNRINIMFRSGVLTGSSIYPNPNLLNLKGGAYTFDVSPRLGKKEAFERLKQMECVLSGHNFVGTKAWIVFVYKDERDLERKLVNIREIIGNDEGSLTKIPFPPCTSTLTQSEARLILELSRGGLDSYAKLQRKVGIPVRSLKRIMSNAVRNNKILSIPKINYGAIAGSVPADLLIFFDQNNKDRAAAEAKVLDIVKDYVILAALFDVVGMCSLILPRVAQLGEIVETIKQIDGIREATIEIVSEHVHRGEILAAYIEKK